MYLQEVFSFFFFFNLRALQVFCRDKGSYNEITHISRDYEVDGFSFVSLH